jgi:hypothetical protein
MKMTTKNVLAAIRAEGMTAAYDNREYRVNYRAGKEVTAYYTNDPQDAIDTAKYMRKEREKK